ncbi:MAG TPA: queuosine precursor transporter [Candidatus Ornithospirochaeta avicola]|uniref:Probable queuosine precursor transporter n=1 Tax=Candidatus Ornithospirochaeta avicola TaxID=2840896 RepID=A0A9D1PS80_9SPIO|nr:queuosine precursor transporter [Candidatus Ornithospirochaeta avicola]
MNKVTENPSKNRLGSFSPLTVISSLLVMLYLTANLMAVKVITVCGLSVFDAGTITFPFAYMLSDVLAEVWGYKTARKVIITTFFCNVALIIFTSIGIILPYPEYMESMQRSYTEVFSYVPRITVASLIAFLSGQLVNAKVLVKMKERQKDGRLLFLRTIFSSICGYVFDTLIFTVIAFYGTVSREDLLSMIVLQYIAKTLIEALIGTPCAYLIIGYLRRNYGFK